MNRLVVTPEEAADMLKEQKASVYSKLRKGEIPAYRSGKEWKIPIKTLEQYIENKAIIEAKTRREMSKNEEV